jgi:hypothetical protein
MSTVLHSGTNPLVCALAGALGGWLVGLAWLLLTASWRRVRVLMRLKAQAEASETLHKREPPDA